MPTVTLNAASRTDGALSGNLSGFHPYALRPQPTESISRKRLVAMDSTRFQTENVIDELLERSRRYWENELPIHKGEIRSYNRSEHRPTVSIAVVSMAARVEHLNRRLEEFSRFQRALPRERFEAVIVLPDVSNYDAEKRARLEEAIVACGVPATLVVSLRNNLGTNRNLATSEARVGECGSILFLDDDVRISPETMGQMLDIWRRSPRLGMLTVPSFTPASQMYKPNYSYSVAELDSEVLALDRYGGMIGLTSARFARIVPFCPAVDLGDDSILSMQLNNLGLVIGCANLPADSAVHEHSRTQASVGHKNFWKYLTYTAVTKFLEPDGFETYDSKTAGHRMSVMMTGAPQAPWSEAREEFGNAGFAYLLGDNRAFSTLRVSLHPEISPHTERAIASLAANGPRLRQFCEEQYRPLKLNLLEKAPYIGPFDR